MNVKRKNEIKLVLSIILFIVSAIGIVFCDYLRRKVQFIDTTPPQIEILEDDLRFFDDDEIFYFDYVKVSDDSGEYTLNITNKEELKEVGENTINYEAIDPSGNVSNAQIVINVVSGEEWRNNVINSTYNYAYRRYENSNLDIEKGEADIDAFELAKNFIGMPGGCNEVAQAFLNAYFGSGYSIYNTYDVSYEEALPGDVIFYANGGIGLQHWAVYLGGSSALQGNINGTTVIGSVYMSHGSTPQFKRVVGVE